MKGKDAEARCRELEAKLDLAVERLSRSFVIDEPSRQLVLLALAVLSKRRPGLGPHLAELAERFGGRAMFEEFRRDEG